MRLCLLLLTAALALSGCTASGPVFNEAMVPKGNGATLIIYRDGGPMGIAASTYSIDINNAARCDLHPNSVFIAQNVFGTSTVSSSLFGAPGTSRLAIETKPKQVYYVRMSINGGKATAGAFGGLVGELIAEGASSTGGPFVFSLVAPDQARQEMASMRVEEHCK